MIWRVSVCIQHYRSKHKSKVSKKDFVRWKHVKNEEEKNWIKNFSFENFYQQKKGVSAHCVCVDPIPPEWFVNKILVCLQFLWNAFKIYPTKKKSRVCSFFSRSILWPLPCSTSAVRSNQSLSLSVIL